jgi:deoxyribodipyrimidine photo-lyase
MDVALVLFTRDLRVRDNPALARACARARSVLPLFVVDPALPVPPNRARFLAESVAVLREELRALGGDLVIRRGDPAAAAVRLATRVQAEAVFVAGDVTRYAARRTERLARECARHRMALEVTPGHAVVPAGELRPAGGDHYRLFTPYWRAWQAAAWRRPDEAPPSVRAPAGIEPGELPDAVTGCSPALAPGGERAGLDRARAWLDGPVAGYDVRHDDLAADGTSRLSAYLRFGCVSPLELARSALARPGGAEFCRQLAWRDFFHQVTAAFPDMGRADYRPGAAGPRAWTQDQDALDAWRAGRTGIPIVDAGLRQLAAEGFMHNRARMITASFLTKTLGIDWRHGYRHFAGLLADGDVANNAGNWQWVAGTGNNPRPGRVLNPLRQAERFDRDGGYVRRYVPELAPLAAPLIHTPWKLPEATRRQLGYPGPVTDRLAGRGLTPQAPG